MRPPCFLLALLLYAPSLRAQVFQPLGQLPAPFPSSSATAVSADGRVVVGQSRNEEGFDRAFRWTAETGLVDLFAGLPGDGVFGYGRGTSADGAVVAGYVYTDERPEAFRWTEETGVTLLDVPAWAEGGDAYGVSADGAVIVGRAYANGGSESEAHRWEDGVMEGLGDLPGGNDQSVAQSASADGTVVVGYGRTDDGYEAFRWEDGVMEGLGDLPGGLFESFAFGVSADGSVVVGQGHGAEGREAFRWTAAGGMQGLGDLPGGSFASTAFGVSADGSVVVGGGNGADGRDGFIWTAEDGMRSLREVLEQDYGADLTGWTDLSATGVSADGTVIVGTGTNPQGQYEAFRAELLAVWLDPVSGFFNEPTRWSIAAVPGEEHAVLFGAPTEAPYTVTFVQDKTTRRLAVDDSEVVFDLGGATYTLAQTDGAALTVGNGTPAVLFAEGGTLVAQDAVLGQASSGDGFFQVGGDAPATLSLSGVLTAGARGDGLFGVLGGSTATVHRGLSAGDAAGSNGSVLVDGLLQVTEGGLGTYVGYEGVGELVVRSGGTLSLNGLVHVGSAASGDGTLRLLDGASGLTNGALQIGVAGTGGLDVLGGSALTSNDVTLGLQPGSFGTALVEGAGSRWQVGGPMNVGVQGAALVQLQDGAIFCANTFTYAIGPQGTVRVFGDVIISDDPSACPAPSPEAATRSGGALLVTPTLFLADGAELEADAVTLEAGGTLGGDGTLALPVTNAGTLAPGGPGAFGTFTLAADYAQGSAGVLAVELGAPTGGGYDRLAVTGAAALGGTLALGRLGGHPFAVGDTYTVLTAGSRTGTFAAVVEPPNLDVAVSYDGTSVTVTVTGVYTASEPGAEGPSAFALHGAYPNPFTRTTTLRYDVAEAGPVRLAVYDLLGREVAVLADGEQASGSHEAVLDARALPAGTYLVRMAAGDFTQTRRLTLLR